jgi:hypothetical protein
LQSVEQTFSLEKDRKFEEPSARAYGESLQQEPSARAYGKSLRREPSARAFGKSLRQEPSARAFGKSLRRERFARESKGTCSGSKAFNTVYRK